MGAAKSRGAASAWGQARRGRLKTETIALIGTDRLSLARLVTSVFVIRDLPVLADASDVWRAGKWFR